MGSLIVCVLIWAGSDEAPETFRNLFRRTILCMIFHRDEKDFQPKGTRLVGPCLAVGGLVCSELIGG